MLERKHGNGRLVRKRARRSPAGRRIWSRATSGLPTKLHPPCLHGLSNVLENLWPKIIPTDLDFTPNLPISVIRYANSTGLGNTLQPGGDVDTVSENVVVVDNDISDMNADPEFDPHILRDIGILRGQRTLDLNAATHGINGTSKLNQHAVTGSFDDTTTMEGYRRINERLPDRL